MAMLLHQGRILSLTVKQNYALSLAMEIFEGEKNGMRQREVW